jgi:TrmH family RNA methyltransferase
MDAISSQQNPRVKEAVKLRDGRERRRLKRFRIDGARELRRAIELGLELAEVFICPALCRSDDCRWVLESLTRLPVPQLQVTPAVFAKLAFGDREEGIVAVANSPERSLDELKLPRTPLVAVLEGVEKPGNVGAVLRSADAAGLDALVVADGGTDLYNPNTIRASIGTIFTVPVCAAPAAAVRAWLAARKVPIFAARVDAGVNYTDVDLSGPTALLLGSEATGLSGVWNPPGVTPIRLPMHGIADSLNVAAAAAVLFYEAIRQRAAAKRK